MDDGKRVLLELARAVERAGPRCVVVGGAAHALHARIAPESPDAPESLRTLDIDVAVDDGDTPWGFRVDDALIGRGFEPRFSGDDRPPATRFHFAPNSVQYVEFVTRRRGSSRTVDVAGATAVRLQYVDLLLREPLVVELTRSAGFELDDGEVKRLWVANPACFLAQKLLVLARRGRDRPKDIAYLYETLRLFSSELAELSARWRELRPSGPKFQRDLRSASSRLLEQLTDDVRSAAELLNAAGGRRIQAQSLLDALRAGLGRVFGAH